MFLRFLSIDRLVIWFIMFTYGEIFAGKEMYSVKQG
jgi:hypothetical protein